MTERPLRILQGWLARSYAQAKFTLWSMSDVSAQRTIIAGRLFTIPLKTERAAS